MSREKALQPLGAMRSLPERAASGEVALREAVEPSELGDEKNGLGRFLDGAVSPRATASMAVAPDIEVDDTDGRISICAVKQKNGQLGVR